MTSPGDVAEPDVRVCADARDLSERAAAATAATITDAVGRHGRCSLVLSGGHTPRALYEQLASTYRDQIPWSEVHVFWGDERYVEPEAAASNYRMARESLLDHVPLPVRNVHPMPTRLAPPDAAARDYERTLRAEVGRQQPPFESRAARDRRRRAHRLAVPAFSCPGGDRAVGCFRDRSRRAAHSPDLDASGHHGREPCLRSRVGSHEGSCAGSRPGSGKRSPRLPSRRAAIGARDRDVVGRSGRRVWLNRRGHLNPLRVHAPGPAWPPPPPAPA